MYSQTTHSVSITVKPSAVENQSNPEQAIFVFSYFIEIENLGVETIQLMDRHWIITSGGRPFDEVKGPGVVGQQPILEQGDKFEYSSGAVIEDPFGSMHGTYLMRTSTGKTLEVTIPQFDLVYPSQIQ